MALHFGADEPRVLAFETVTDAYMVTTSEWQVPAPTIASYDLNKVMEAARGWQEKAAAAPDPAAGEGMPVAVPRSSNVWLRARWTPRPSADLPVVGPRTGFCAGLGSVYPRSCNRTRVWPCKTSSRSNAH